jgi:hypothetical protein
MKEDLYPVKNRWNYIRTAFKCLQPHDHESNDYEYDHEAFLGQEADEFDNLSPGGKLHYLFCKYSVFYT